MQNVTVMVMMVMTCTDTDTNIRNNNENRGGHSRALEVFENEIQKVDSLVRYLQNIGKDSKEVEVQVEVEEDCTKSARETKLGCKSTGAGAGTCAVAVAVAGVGISTRDDFDDLWDEVQAAGLSSDSETEDCSLNQEEGRNEPPAICRGGSGSNSGGDEETQNAVEQVTKTPICSTNAAMDETNIIATHTCAHVHTNTLTAPTMKAYEKIALDLRPILLQMADNAVASEMETMTSKILSVLKDGGTQDGVEGIVRVGSLLKRGSSKHENESTDADADADSVENMNPFSGVLLSYLSKAYVTNILSASRVLAFLTSFVLPSLLELNDPKSRAASRQLVTTLTYLARDRPTECIDALFVPILTGAASKAQCELINRIIKTAPSDELPKLISGIIPMTITEPSVLVITTCIQKKPMLSESTIVAIVEKLKKCGGEADLLRSTKYSSFFHTFVNKFGTQLKMVHVNELLEASAKLKTFSSKSIATSLKKLKKKMEK